MHIEKVAPADIPDLSGLVSVLFSQEGESNTIVADMNSRHGAQSPGFLGVVS